MLMSMNKVSPDNLSVYTELANGIFEWNYEGNPLISFTWGFQRWIMKIIIYSWANSPNYSRA